MVDWKRLLEDDDRERARAGEDDEGDDWRQEAADSLCELYYETYRTQKRRGGGQRLDLRPGSDFRRFLESHLRPLARHGVWEALFPNRSSATSAQAIDEALHLLADTKLVDRVYSGDIVTVTKIVSNIAKKRAKYLELEGRGGAAAAAAAIAGAGDGLDDDEVTAFTADEDTDAGVDLEEVDADVSAADADADADADVGEVDADIDADAEGDPDDDEA